MVLPFKLAPLILKEPAFLVVTPFIIAVLGTLQKLHLLLVVMHWGKLSGLLGPFIMHVLYCALL